jgi:3-hydroxy-9,10-secoandrosta-1,3,5(10)-triene-9,17-dione monooxygenase reductase component
MALARIDPVKPGATAAATINSSDFRRVLGHFPTGVAVITTMARQGPVGLAVGSFFSISLDPPLVGFCAAGTSTSWPAIKAAGTYCVHVLAGDQRHISTAFAVSGSDKFAGLDWDLERTASPRIAGALAWIDCDIVDIHTAGDHEICVGRVRDLAVERDTGPLVFFQGGYR